MTAESPMAPAVAGSRSPGDPASTALTLTQIHRVAVGDGPPVVLLHGLAEDHTSWQPQLDGPHRLEGARVVAVDMRGHGRTPVADGDGTLAQLAHDLARVLREGTGPAIVVGFSLGGTVVLEAARRWPELVTHAAVLGTSSVVGRQARGFFLDRIELADSGDRGALAEMLREDTRLQLARDDVDLDAVTAARVAAVGDGRGYANAARAMVGLADHPLTGQLSELTVPVTVIGAEHDAFCPRKAADILIDALPDATYRHIDGAGHLVNVDRPDAVSSILQQIINTKGPS